MQLRPDDYLHAQRRIAPVAPLWSAGGRSGFSGGTYGEDGLKLRVSDGLEVSSLHGSPARLGG